MEKKPKTAREWELERLHERDLMRVDELCDQALERLARFNEKPKDTFDELDLYRNRNQKKLVTGSETTKENGFDSLDLYSEKMKKRPQSPNGSI